jgi:hypothetical protein
MSHTITPNYKITGEPVAGFRLGFSAQVPIKITSSSVTTYSEQHVETVTTYNSGRSTRDTTLTRTNVLTGNENSESTVFEAPLELNFGASYKLIPDRFAINAGIYAIPTKFKHSKKTTLPSHVTKTTTNTFVDEDGDTTNSVVVDSNQNPTDKVETSTTWDGFNGGVSGGFVFNFTPNAALDMFVGTEFPTAGNRDSFNLDLAKVNILFSIKF